MLRVIDVSVRFGALVAVDKVSIEVACAEPVAILGPNGAGKTSLLNAISGFDANPLLDPIVTGAVYLSDERLDFERAFARAVKGIGHCGQGRERTIASLTVEDNLRLGGRSLERHARTARVADIYSLFPALADRRRQRSGTLSGGEQQMLAIARALMVPPRVLLLDEPALGLAPRIVHQLYEALVCLIETESMALVLVEQNPARALALASRGYIMQAGRIVRAGNADELRTTPELQSAYLA